MKKTSRRLLALLLCAVLCLCLAPAASAADAEIAREGGFYDGDYQTFSYTLSKDGTLRIKNTSSSAHSLETMSEASVPWRAEGWLDEIKKIVIGEGITGADCFSDCVNLTEVDFGSTVKNIGHSAFSGCSALRSVTIPAQVSWISEKAFLNCKGLEEIRVSADNTVFCSVDGVLYNKAMSHIYLYPASKEGSSYVIPNTVTGITDYSFQNASKLQSVTLGAGVNRVGTFAFLGCTSLTSFAVSAKNDNFTAVDGVLYNKAKDYLERVPTGRTGSLTILEGVTDMSRYAIYGGSLSEVTLPASLGDLGQSVDTVFTDTSKLKAIKVASGNVNYRSVGGVLFDASGTVLLAYPHAKSGAYTIPEGTDSIYRYAFSHAAGLTELVIPASVTKFGDSAFSYCSALKKIYFDGNAPRLALSYGTSKGYTFYGDTATAYYPVDAGGWNSDVMKSYDGSITWKTRPGAPEELTLKLSADKPLLTWQAAAGDSKFQVYRATSENGSYTRIATVTAVSYQDTGAPAGKTCWYKVRALDGSGIPSAYSEKQSVTVPPEAPTVTGELASGKPKLTWPAVTGAAKYEIWRSTTGKSGSYTRLTTTTSLTYTNSKAAAGTAYYYQVRALTKDGTQGAFSEAVKLTTKPAAPTVTGKLNDSRKPVLSWKAVKGAVKYEIWRSTTGKAGSFTRLTTTTKLTYTNSKATVGKTYYYKVRALDAEGQAGDFSSAVKLAVKPAAPAPEGKLNTSGKPLLSWEKVSGAAKYEIWLSTTGKSGSFKKLSTTSKLTYTNSKAETGKTYYYKVKAVSASGVKSDFSAIVQLTAKGKPAAPSVTGKLSTKGKPVLSWKAVSGAVEYQIWRSTTGKDGSFKQQTTVTALKYTDSAAKTGKTYYYKVKAVSDDGKKSTFSGIVKLKAEEAPAPGEKLPAPAVTTGFGSQGGLELSWEAVTGAVKYQVWRSSTSSTEGFTRVATVKGTNYALDGSDKGTFYYKVRAVAEDGTKGVYSTVLTITFK